VILPAVTLTPALAAWIRAAHDDGASDLEVAGYARDDGSPYARVERADGSELSPTEEREVRALLAAHAVEPLRIPR